MVGLLQVLSRKQAMKRTYLLFILLLAIFTEFNATSGSKPQTVIIKDVPHVMQRPDFCGEACVAMALGKLKHAGTQDWVFNHSGLKPLQGRGCYTPDLATALKAIGFKPGPVGFTVSATNADKELRALWQKTVDDLRRNIPSIVCMRSNDRPHASEHMRLVVGYDPDKKEVIYHEPAEKDGAYQHMDLTTFLDLWPINKSTANWTVIRFRMEAGKLKEYVAPTGFTDADYTQHYMELKKRVPSGFTVTLEKPFFVIGNDTPQVIETRWAKGTVHWAVSKFKELYFTKDPNNILDVWLFKDDASYRKYNKELWGTEPSTPFGYYSQVKRALVMNIATGGGTLVHEIVHPFMEANFPACPDWLNEGMGSLYEQSAYRDDKIVGLTNWRLAGLQDAIRNKTLPSFKRMITVDDFYRQPTGYGQARYLCYYLQNKDLLIKFYQEFRANADKDPSGYNTLKKVLGVNDMDTFQKKWESWVLKLKFPPST